MRKIQINSFEDLEKLSLGELPLNAHYELTADIDASATKKDYNLTTSGLNEDSSYGIEELGDFNLKDSEWRIDEGEGYPYLWWEKEQIQYGPKQKFKEGNFVGEGSVNIGGSGTEDDPYLISNFSELEQIGKENYTLDSNYKLTNNIDCSITSNSNYNEGRGFKPIDTFQGSFDGDWHQIKSLCVNIEEENHRYAGLFGYIEDSIIKNLKITEATIYGDSYLGILCGRISGSQVSNCYSSGEVSGRWRIGGLLGQSDLDSTVSFSCSESIEITSKDSMIGGFIGNVRSSNFDNCYVSSFIINGADRTGGFTGQNYEGIIKHCYVENGKIYSEGSSVGGITGSTSGSSKFYYCYSSCDIEGNFKSMIGGIVGYFSDSSNSSEIKSCYSNANITTLADPNSDNDDSWAMGGIAGRAYSNQTGSTPGAKIEDCYFKGNLKADRTHAGILGYSRIRYNGWTNSYSTNTIKRCLVIGLVSGVSHGGVIFGASNQNVSRTKILECYNDASISGYVNSTSYRDNREIFYEPYAARTYGSLIIKERGWKPIGDKDDPFTGCFDFNNHKISNLYIYRLDENQGLFGYTVNAELKNLQLENAEVIGYESCACLTGKSLSTKISNIKSTNSHVRAQLNSSLLVGSGENSRINNCSVEGVVISQNSGGIHGGSSWTAGDTHISNCSFSGKIYSAHYAGGIASSVRNYSIIKDCSSSGTLYLTRRMNYRSGGIVGESNYSYLRNCKSSIDIVWVHNDISDYLKNNIPYLNIRRIGGIVGYMYNSRTTIDNAIYNCEFDGNIIFKATISRPDRIGGIIGGARFGNYSIRKSSFLGTIHLESSSRFCNIGGIFGILDNPLYDTAEMSDCYCKKGSKITLKDLNVENKDNDGFRSLNIGGLGGCIRAFSINRCYSDLELELDPNFYYRVGGLIGYSSQSTLNNNYSKTSVGGYKSVGGFIGELSYSSIQGDLLVDGGYSCGEVKSGVHPNSDTDPDYVTEPDSINGFIGKVSTFADDDPYESKESNNNYWDIETSGIDTDFVSETGLSLAQGMTTEEMMKQETFEDWDFNHVWKVEENESYPYFDIRLIEIPKNKPESEIKNYKLDSELIPHDIWNVFDEFALFYDIQRLEGESNESLKGRTLNAANEEMSSTKHGLLNSISNELNIDKEKVKLNKLSDDKYIEVELTDINGSKTDEFSNIVQEINNRVPLLWGDFIWGESYWDVIDRQGYKSSPNKIDGTSFLSIKNKGVD